MSVQCSTLSAINRKHHQAHRATVARPPRNPMHRPMAALFVRVTEKGEHEGHEAEVTKICVTSSIAFIPSYPLFALAVFPKLCRRADNHLVSPAFGFEVLEISGDQRVCEAGYGHFQKRQIGRIRKQDVNISHADMFA